MPYFLPGDVSAAVVAMLAHADRADPVLLGKLNGIKRRARARAVVAFCLDLDPPPPDVSITSMQTLQRRLFGRAVSHGDLLRNFSTPGRKANDRVDMEEADAWWVENMEALLQAAAALLAELAKEWRELTQTAAREAGEMRRKDFADERAALADCDHLR